MDALAKQIVLSSGESLNSIDIEKEQRIAAGKPAEAATTEVIEPAKPAETVDLDLAFDAAKMGLEIPVVKPSEEVKPEETIEEETIEEETVKETSVVTPAKAAAPAQPEARVLDDIELELQPLFKQMSNEAFKRLKPIYLEKRKLAEELSEVKSKQGLPDSYYEHELAYVLTPEFNQQSVRANDAATVLGHWKQQLANVRSGADEYQKLEVDDKTGQFRLSQPIKVDRNTLTELEDIRTWAHEQYSEYNGQLQSFVKTHQSRNADVKNWTKEFESRAFPVFQQKPELQAMVDDTVKKVLHPALQKSPVARFLGMSILIMTEQANIIKSLQTKAPQTKAQQQPSAAELAGGGVKPGKTNNEDIDELFEKAKRGEI